MEKQTILNSPTRAQELVMIHSALGLAYNFGKKWGFKKSAKVARAEIKRLVESLKTLVPEKERKKHQHRMLLLLEDIGTRASYHVYARALIEHIRYLRELRGDYGKADGN